MSKPDSIRCFIAIEIPEKIQNIILEIQNKLRSKVVGATWTKSGNHHLTLKFIGQVERPQLSRIEYILSKIAKQNGQFTIEFGGLGVFPNWERPRVLWIGLTKGESKIRVLSVSINKGLNELLYPIDNRFHPHLTLARFKKQVNKLNRPDSFREYETLATSGFLIEEFTLVMSELHPKGAIYTPINTFKMS